MTVSPEHFFRVAIAKESSFKTAGSYVVARGLKQGSTVTPGRETIPIEASLNSFGDRYADIPGAQTYEAAIDLYLHAAWFTDYADLFEAAFGTKDTVTSSTFVSSADNFTISVTGNAAAALVKVTGSDSKTYIVPVDVDAGSGSRDITLGVGLPGGVTATAIVNPGSAGGACFEYGDIGVASDTFSIESDWATKPTSTTQENILCSGCALTSFTFVMERGGPIILQTKWIGASYSEGGGAGANTSDASAWTAEGPAWASDMILTTAASPTWAAGTAIAWKALSFEVCPPLFVERGGTGLDGGSTAASLMAGSDITGYTRDAGWEGLVTVRVPYNKQYLIDFAAQTAFRLLLVMYPGVPQGATLSTTKRTALYFRRLVPQGRPVVVADGGGRYHDLTFKVERDRTATGNVERVAFARFNS